ncbi:MAG: hypothetical protein IK030_03710 [Bacteroidales bacterium]|nr:hypothetical protein [Bacteroidales bacterium]
MRFKAILTVLLALAAFSAAAQEQLTPEQREKQLYENIQKQVDDLTLSLKLEDWQVFYLDSILVNNFTAMSAEFEEMSKNRVSSQDLYIYIQDKWMDETYNAIHKILDDNQWQKYLKQGAAKAKKARDKRAEKRENQK